MLPDDALMRQNRRKRGLSRSLADVGLGEFFRQLEYKCAWRGVRLLKIGRWEPSSKRCSTCGEINASLTLTMRSWTCPGCGTLHHRDINAARNIAALAPVENPKVNDKSVC